MSANAVRPVSPAYGTALAWPPDELAGRSERRRAEEALRRSERERAEEALQETAETLRALIQASPLAIVLLDLDENVRAWNPAAEGMYGWSEDEVLGTPLPTRPADRIEEYRSLHEMVRRGERTTGFETRRLRKDGSLIDVSVSVAPLRDVNGEIRGTVGLHADITEKKQAEQERALLEERLRLSQKLEAVGRLAGGIAHDFNNHLTAIMGSTDLLLRRLDGDDRELVDEIGHAAERAAALTHQLLAFSRRQVLEPRVLDLNAAVGETTRMLGRLIGEHIELVARLDPALGSVRVDPSQLEQVIMNLTLNARDAMPAGGRLTIETANVDLDEPYAAPQFVIQPGRYVVLAVTDTGCGMDAETRAQVFEPFFTTKEPGKGTGLGLATVYGVVKQSGGYIAAESEPGRGSAFRIYLPRVEGRATEAPLGLVRSSSLGGSETVLLAEDDDAVRRLVRRALEEHGYTVLEAPDGRAALEIGELYGEPLDLLITDVVMPAMGGNEVAVQLTMRYPGLRVLYMSGYSGDYVQRGNPGVSPLVKKPFTLDSLVGKVRQVLDAG